MHFLSIFPQNVDPYHRAISYLPALASPQGYRGVYNGPDTTFAVSSLKPNTQYRFRISASNSEGSSQPSLALNVTTPPSLPSAPGLPILCGPPLLTSVIVEWLPNLESDLVTAYSLHMVMLEEQVQKQWRSLKGASLVDHPGFKEVYRGPAKPVQCDGLLPGTAYLFRVQGHNSGGSGAFSKVAIIATCPVPPHAPTILAAQPKATLIDLTLREPAHFGGADIASYR